MLRNIEIVFLKVQIGKNYLDYYFLQHLAKDLLFTQAKIPMSQTRNLLIFLSQQIQADRSQDSAVQVILEVLIFLEKKRVQIVPGSGETGMLTPTYLCFGSLIFFQCIMEI